MTNLIVVKTIDTKDIYKLFKDEGKYFIQFRQYDNGWGETPTEKWNSELKADSYHGAIEEFFNMVTHDVQHFAE